MRTTKQVNKKVPNPTGKGGFQERPEDRSDGRWKKEESIPYLYNKLGRMSPEELSEYIPNTIFEKIALSRLNSASDLEKGLPDAKEITDRTEGKAAQSIDVTSKGNMIGATIVFSEHPEIDNTNT